MDTNLQKASQTRHCLSRRVQEGRAHVLSKLKQKVKGSIINI